MGRISFNKFSVLLMYLMVIGFFAFCAITTAYPPAEFTFCWFGFWIAQAIITCVLKTKERTNKRKSDGQIRLLEAVTPYINTENVEKVVEKYTGIDLDYKVKKPKEYKVVDKKEGVK